MAARTIVAKFDGRCAECGDDIQAGDTVVFDTEERKIYCEACGEDV